MTLQEFLGIILVVSLILVSILVSFRVASRVGTGDSRFVLIPSIWVAMTAFSVVVVTEVLSLFKTLDTFWVTATWLVVLAGAVYFYRKLKPFQSFSIEKFGAFEASIFTFLVVLLALTAIVSIIGAPNNADSLGYHNARVMHWLIQKSVEHYFALDHRQLRMPPLASFLRLHAMVLMGSDLLFNFTQWVAYVLTVGISTCVGYQLSQKKSVAVLAGFFSAVIPMSILQSVSSQNDLITAAFSIAAVSVLLEMRASGREWHSALFWVLLGLGALCKGTFYVYGAFLVLLAVPSYWRFRRSWSVHSWMITGGAVLLALSVNIPHLWRNHQYFHEGVPQPETVSLKEWVSGPPSDIIKKITDQIMMTSVLEIDLLKKMPHIKKVVLSSVQSFENHFKVETSPLRLSSGADLQYFLDAPVPDEDYAGSAIHFLMYLVTAFLLMKAYFRTKQGTDALIVAAVAGLSGLAIAIEVKWMPWNNRLLLPSVVMACPAIAIAFDSHRSWLKKGVVALLMIAALPYLVLNYHHPWISRHDETSVFFTSRWDDFFRGNPALEISVQELIKNLPANCSIKNPVGILDEMSPEYLLWAAARKSGKALRFESVGNDLASGHYCARVKMCSASSFCIDRI